MYHSVYDLTVSSPLICISTPGPANPVQPQNLMNISTRHDRATVQWSVSYIAYTPETYTVRYGRAMNSLNISVTATPRGDTFAIPSQPFIFSAELTGLSPGVTYYYQVEARNSVGPTLSAVQQFTSAERRMYMTCLCIHMSVCTKYFWASMNLLYCVLLLPLHVPSPSSSNYVQLLSHAWAMPRNGAGKDCHFAQDVFLHDSALNMLFNGISNLTSILYK